VDMAQLLYRERQCGGLACDPGKSTMQHTWWWDISWYHAPLGVFSGNQQTQLGVDGDRLRAC
jgi:hypothetical protein